MALVSRLYHFVLNQLCFLAVNFMAVKRSVIYCLFSCFATLHCFALWCGVILALFRF